MQKRYIAALLAALMLITCLGGCQNNRQEEPVITTESTTAKEKDNTNFKLSYTQADSLDPFKAKTENNQVLASLVFEPLFTLDENYNATPVLADGYEYIDSKTLKVSLKTDLEFSDGSKIDVEDVVFSVNAAKKSDAYASSLAGIKACEGSSNAVIIYLKYANPYAVNLLTFPICSVNDDKAGYPIGSGRYKYKTSGGKTVLVANDKKTDFNPYISTINLVNIAAADSIDNAVNIGNISYSFKDMSSDTSKRMSCAKKAINMNNLVYIGINTYGNATANAQIRKAISLAVDRETLVESAYSGYAKVAYSAFHPDFTSIGNVNLFDKNSDSATARQAVLKTGLDDKALKLSIIVDDNENKAACANLLKSQLEAAGFNIKIERLSHKEYLRRIKALEFDLYIGEVKLSDDMCLYPFLSKTGGARYGINLKAMSCDDFYVKYLNGSEELGKFVLAFNDDMPYIPLLYKKGMICYSKSLKGDMQGYYGNFFSNIESWNFSS